MFKEGDSTMNEIINFLQTNKVFFLATTVDNVPHVRPMGFVMEYKGRITFCTSNHKNLYKQLVANPQVEVCSLDSDNNFLRLTGKVIFCTSEESQTKALETVPSLRSIYAVGDGALEVFYLETAHAILQTMSGEQKIFNI